ncbi:hypothetical protein BJ944DRAFT_263427 [Cunninghamella echinulata]|nr:hypothetical protein BJ944DRAFT_263427 [Cunninghamella echinulata]
MNFFPNEILEHIFTYLSHWNKTQCALVDKKWNDILRLPLFYKTITIYNSKQLEKFIQMATTVYINQHLVGFFVENLLLEGYCNGLEDNQDIIPLIRRLNVACPNVNYIDSILSVYGHSPYDFSLWPNLKTIPGWVQNRDKNWYQRISNHNNKYTSLEFNINNNMIAQLHPPTEEEEEEEEKEKGEDTKLILFEKDQHMELRKLTDYPIAKHYLNIHDINDNDRIDIIINNEEYTHYSGSIMSFSIKVKANFMHLKDLTIGFQQCAYYVYCFGEEIRFEMDERTIENIHQSCPQLESLALKDIVINISNQYIQHKLLSSPASSDLFMYQPCRSLKKLTLHQLSPQHPYCFDYFSKKYPQLTNLNMQLIILTWDNESTAFNKECELSLMDMITHYPNLSSLSVGMMDPTFDSMASLHWIEPFWNHSAFFKWLSQNPTQLRSLAYPFSFHTIEKNNDDNNGVVNKYNRFLPLPLDTPDTNNDNTDDDDDENEEESEIKQRYAYLDHIKELNLVNEFNSNETYHYLFYIKEIKHYTNFLNLTSLHLKHFGLAFGKWKAKRGPLDIYSWLKLFPNLKRLQLDNVLTINMDNDDVVDDIDKGNDKKIEKSSIPIKQSNQKKSFPLEELVLKNCTIRTINGLANLSDACPHLHILKIEKVEFITTQEEEKEKVKYQGSPYLSLYEKDYPDQYGQWRVLDINAPRWELDELVIHNISTRLGRIPLAYPPKELMIQAPRYKRTYTSSKNMHCKKNIRMVMNCKYVDLVNFI